MVVALTARANAASQTRRVTQDGYGSFSEVRDRIGEVRVTPINGLRQSGLSGPKVPYAEVIGTGPDNWQTTDLSKYMKHIELFMRKVAAGANRGPRRSAGPRYVPF
jgi:hypothetical protein